MVLLAVEDEFKPILSEHLAYQWVSPEQAVQMTKSPNNAAAIKKYLMSSAPL
ncbi:dihydroneopterin triphosphate pyrophosphatase [Haemophilus pittmaniae HK 85]|uniref:Dihydroneopterin triphosphate pyrophosphatase n=1 Tax=Haemophilus pittmaniae HK 85 TaxID=1035188 RepID=F9QA18_9PAST|nr:dihydroneopterin triphosphate pyrophosphatase [Haemophilus pittmaniae HK 85]